MHHASVDDIAVITDLLFQAALEERQWQPAVERLKGLLGASMVGLGHFDLSGRAALIYGDCDPCFEQAAFAPEAPSPFLPSLLYGAPGSVVADQSLMTRMAFERSAFFNEWLTPQSCGSMLVAHIGRVGPLNGFLSLTRERGRPPFDDADIRLASALVPALSRASALRLHVGRLRLTSKTTAYDRLKVGMAVVDYDLRPLHMNDTAVRITDDVQSGLLVCGGRLSLEGGHTKKLRCLVHDALGTLGVGGSMVLLDQQRGSPNLALTVAPLKDGTAYGLPVIGAAIIFIQSLRSAISVSFQKHAQATFDLTSKEASLAAALVAGHSLKRAADERCVSIHTVRTQLSQLFRKTGTTHQSELVAMLLRIFPVTD